ncbi:hypothetical protein BSPWISOXPB_6518 [uncultured Gammaproteobacteria bacterium]|nr:hypothetical protein BSPWISOXPB_6518 [uncultured Gammaproteobacteria bacterium]
MYGNVIGDARKLKALEELMGQEWLGTWCGEIVIETHMVKQH